MVADPPKVCNVGTKRNSKGHQISWISYKRHIDAANSRILISRILTPASLHDSQFATPLAKITCGRVSSLYDMMDSA